MEKPGTIPWYKELWKQCTFDKGFESQIKRATDRVLAGKTRYESVSKITKVPWYVIGALHNMEASCDFTGVLHNGERIIGKGVKTKLVPKGRGPFASWEESAVDSLKYDGIYLITDWSIGNILKAAEAYNGTGYLKYHPEEKSPYLWACTSINDGKGKYVADGKWDHNAPTNGQVGFAAILKQLELDGKIRLS